MPLSPRRRCAFFILRVTLVGLGLSCLLLVPPAWSAVPRHIPGDHDQAVSAEETASSTQEHAGHTMDRAMDHTGHDQPADDDHAGHAPSDEETAHADHAMDDAEHVHPDANLASSDEVGLDEQLGALLPPGLTFRDESGQPVALSSLITKPTVIAPIYYRCPNVCHFLQGDLARVLPQLKLKPGEDFQVISVSFDETDTPELARRSRSTYMTAMDDAIDPAGWRFLTGDREQIAALTDAIGFRFQKVGADFLHPVVLAIVSPEGKIVRYLHGTHIVPKDLTLALYEAQAGRVGSTIRKVVQYCFSFDPEQKTYVLNLLRLSATAILLTLGAFFAFLVISGKKKGKTARHE